MISTIIPAAGKSSRMGAIDKQLVKLEGKEVVIRTIEKFYSIDAINQIIVVINREKEAQMMKLLSKYNLDGVELVIGGDSRQKSIANGLEKILPENQRVLIHDGARPFIQTSIIQEVIQTLEKERAVLVGVPSKDTIKVVEGEYIVTTLDRSKLINVQTPQGFHKDILLDAYNNFSSVAVTDDSALVEKLGVAVKYIQGNYTNIKITTIEDIEIGKRILER